MKHTTNRFIAPARQAIEAGGIDSLESNPGLLKSLQIRALDSFFFFKKMTFPLLSVNYLPDTAVKMQNERKRLIFF
jgi:hypothetical protein